MRVLWFTYTPSLIVARKLGIPIPVSEGWVDSLKLALQSYSDLELGIVSPSEIDYETFHEDGTCFYNIPNPHQKGSLKVIYRRWLHTNEYKNGISSCLEAIEQFKPEIIHVHGSETFYGLITKETSIPVVISLQGILTVCEMFYFGGFTCKDKVNDIVSGNFLRGVGAVHKYLTLRESARRERKIMKTCKYFIGRTEFDKNFVSLINPISNYYHCDEVLRSSFYSAEWSPESNGLHRIYSISSNPVPYKGLDCLLMACRILKSAGFSDIQLRLSGQLQGSDIWGIIKRKVETLNLTKEVVWLGKSSADTIVNELKKASVFVLPSYIENSPNSLGEAMMAGVPSVASYVGGVPSMIHHGEDGLLFPAGDSYSLAAMIAKIFRDPSLAETLARNAKNTAQKRHDPQKIASIMMSIYSDIIADSSKKRD